MYQFVRVCGPLHKKTHFMRLEKYNSIIYKCCPFITVIMYNQYERQYHGLFPIGAI